MKVYHNSNMWEHRKQGDSLTPLSLNLTAFWEGQELLVPAVYLGREGAVLDVCAKIPVEDMAAFLKKWNKERRLSLQMPEEFEQLEADNPSSREFAVQLRLDDTFLVRRMSSSLNWYSDSIIDLTESDWKNDKYAERMMEAYGCDRKCCWHFERLCYDWLAEPILSPKDISLLFQAQSMPVATEHFTTTCETVDASLSDKIIIKTHHPVTGQEYTVTLHQCSQRKNDFTAIGQEGLVYPEYCQVLSYSITPDPDSDFDIRDCAEGDHPRPADPETCKSSSSGAMAVFLAGKNSLPARRSTASSLHFEPVTTVRWRMVFQVKPKEDFLLCSEIH